MKSLNTLANYNTANYDTNAEGGMLVLQLKQLSATDQKFSKSIINGFQFTTDNTNERIFVVS